MHSMPEGKGGGFLSFERMHRREYLVIEEQVGEKDGERSVCVEGTGYGIVGKLDMNELKAQRSSNIEISIRSIRFRYVFKLMPTLFYEYFRSFHLNNEPEWFSNKLTQREVNGRRMSWDQEHEYQDTCGVESITYRKGSGHVQITSDSSILLLFNFNLIYSHLD